MLNFIRKNRIFPQKFTQNYLEQSNDCEFEIITSDNPSLWFSKIIQRSGVMLDDNLLMSYPSSKIINFRS